MLQARHQLKLLLWAVLSLLLITAAVFVWIPRFVMPLLPSCMTTYRYMGWIYYRADDLHTAFVARSLMFSISSEGAPMEGLWYMAGEKNWGRESVIKISRQHLEFGKCDMRLYSGAVELLLSCEDLPTRIQMATEIRDNRVKYGPFQISRAKQILDKEACASGVR